MLEKKCKNCDCDFETNQKNRKYCSNECRIKFYIRGEITTKCACCGESILSKSNRKRYCSSTCQSKIWYKNNTIEENCEICNTTFFRAKHKIKKTCSRICADKMRTKQKVKTKCKNCNKVFEDYKSYNRKFCSNKCVGEYQTMDMNPAWKGGSKNLIVAIRRSKYYDIYKEKCFKRDGYKSILSLKTSKKIHHHHLNSFSYLIDKYKITMDNVWDYKDILFDINNIVTLSDTEHDKFHKIYGYKTTKKDFEDILLDREWVSWGK